MAQQNKPFTWPGFQGINLAGNPVNRPLGTARTCENYRVMPGGWLRLRSGRTAIAAPYSPNAMGELIEFMPMRKNSKNGSRYHLIRANIGANPAYYQLDTDDWSITLITASLTSETDNVRTTLGFATLNESIVYGNSYGGRFGNTLPSGSGFRSVPWLSQYTPGLTARFFGLFYHQNAVQDKVFVPSLNTLIASSGLALVINGSGDNYNNISPSAPVDLYVGLYNERTGHYSNGAVISTGVSTSGAQTILIQDCDNAQAPYHDTDERDEIKIVFYATIPGGRVPYLIMNEDLDGPFTVDYGTATDVSLSIIPTATATSGWVLDLTKRMPVNNYPPRQMRDLCYANGRLWGIIHNWDGVQQVGYEYEIKDVDISGITWSYANGDIRQIEFAGDPLQSWDPRNYAACPSGERPLRLYTAPNEVDVVVLTASRTFIVREQTDGLMEWISISSEHGIHPESLRTLARTRYGLCWVTQRSQIAMLGNDLQLRIISRDFDQLLRDKTLVCGGYVLDPANDVDRYEAFWWSAPFTVSTDFSACPPSYSICFDFATGQAYTTKHTNLTVTAIGQLTDSDGQTFNLMAALSNDGQAEIYKVEGDPTDTFQVPTVDEDITGRNPMVVTDREISTASWESNWFSPDSSQRAELVNIDVIGDVCESADLGHVPVSIETFRDFGQVVAGQGDLLSVDPIDQSTKSPITENNYARFRPVEAHGIHWKLRIAHEAHSADQGDTYTSPGADGVNDKNFYGAIVDMKVLIGEGQNRAS